MDVSQISWTVEEILPEDEEDRGNVPVYAADIPEPKLASPILRALGDAHPLPRLTHVKRIRKTQGPDGAPRMSIVLCPVAEAASRFGSEPVVLPDAVAAVCEKYGLSPFLAEVPGRPARTLEESKDDCQVWPVTFHPNREGAGPVKEELSEEDLRAMWRFMQAALKEAKKAADCGQPANGCVIVDPATHRIVASGFDHSGRPSGHSATMPKGALLKRPQPIISNPPPVRPSLDTAESSLAASATPSAPSDNTIIGGRPLDGACCAQPSEPSVRVIHGGDASERAGPSKLPSAKGCRIQWHPLKHAAIVAVDACARADHEQFPDFGRHSVERSRELEREQDADGSQPAASVSSIQERKLDQGSLVENRSTRTVTESNVTESRSERPLGKTPADIGEEVAENDEKRRKLGSSSLDDTGARAGVFATKPYLCTGFDAYLVREPCTVCAMALVHSRIRRVIYGISNSRTGALGGRYNLQTKKSLNHHYKVFCMKLHESEVKKALC
ncbi:Cytidine deaminase family protein [Klebsormidium nitens]|uniref:Cytidine deaminase family protein n=1 Tax=Klebsormidium nitens TaxID=105231 RepID=A0A1Y1HJ55_KLENI|nr:Cytidine deaminase family protein [Klebsormidium nitens]|eukprot:GAQ78545.1 Cytidine deaminase family protein [Klebsormidium nitens]